MPPRHRVQGLAHLDVDVRPDLAGRPGREHEMLARQRFQRFGLDRFEHRQGCGAAQRSALPPPGHLPAPQHGLFLEVRLRSGQDTPTARGSGSCTRPCQSHRQRVTVVKHGNHPPEDDGDQFSLRLDGVDTVARPGPRSLCDGVVGRETNTRAVAAIVFTLLFWGTAEGFRRGRTPPAPATSVPRSAIRWCSARRRSQRTRIGWKRMVRLAT